MIREILCRGKRIDINEWIEGYYAVSPTDSKSYIYAKDYTEVDIAEDGLHMVYRLMQVFPTTVGQYTGLTDKNGKKIFDGDIVRTKYGRVCKVVFFQSPCFCGIDFIPLEDKHKCPDKFDLYLSDNLEVIGNIHDDFQLTEFI